MLSLSSLLLAAWAAPAQEAASPDLSALLDRTRNLSWLASEIAEGEQSLVFSAAGDAGPATDRETVLFDVDGSGVLGRLYIAQPDGILRFYFGDSETAAVEIAARELFASSGPFRAPLVRLDETRGMINFPLPFADGLKLTTTQSSPRFEAGVHLLGASAGEAWTSFSAQGLAESSRALDRYASEAVSLDFPTIGRRILTTGAVTRMFDHVNVLQGNGIVHWMKITFISADPYTSAELPDLMRDIMLEIRENPESDAPRMLVQVPLGDFLGTAPGLVSWRSHLISVDEAAQSFLIRLPIPYREDFELRLSTDIKLPKDVRVKVDLGFEQLEKAPALRLRSSFFSMRDVPSQPARRLSLGKLQGPGRLVGAVVTSLNPSKEEWDGGSLHINIDGQNAVTGSPLGITEQFDRATRQDGPYAFGYTSRNRFWLHDPLVFRDSLELSMDIEHPESVPMTFEGVLYWYAPDDTDFPFEPLLTSAERRPVAVPEQDFEIESGLVEAERMRVVSAPTAGELTEAAFEGASGTALQWKGSARGKLVKLGVPVDVEGEWRVIGRFWTYPGGPDLQLSLGGKALGNRGLSLDAEVAGWKEIDLGTLLLTAREHTLLLGVLDPGSVEFGVVLDSLQLISAAQ